VRVACPRCGARISRNYSSNAPSNMLGGWGGLIPAMLFSAFAAPECYHCGKIARNEFSLEARLKLAAGAALTIAIALALLAGGIMLGLPHK